MYHITSRGNAQAAIFHDPEDRETFLDTLSGVVGRFGWLCHAYCLMDNHYHLLVETPDPNLSAGMRHLNGIYTQLFNRRHDRAGHVLQGRFKAILVERDSYLLELARYIVLNPVRAGMVTDTARYPWSSYRATAGEEKAPEWLTTDWILAQFAKSAPAARRRYTKFVAQDSSAGPPWSMLKGQVLLGSDDFADRIQSFLEGRENLADIPRTQRLVHRPNLKKIFPKSVRQDKTKRDQAIHQAYAEYGYTMAAIARELGMHYSSVSRILKGER